ncbi:PGRS-subfamily of Gly-rich protein [Granulibacter bethesdensis]|uniref:PGRS-subfamily of Gly-rich protein n=2 Tax=Granulibacter bethesdensis TaxID=364410 RepID=A0AAN0REI4_9PROT|nr:PGRS-subfamily of Gly-rich protein [Granulibacter bethesdensis]
MYLLALVSDPSILDGFMISRLARFFLLIGLTLPGAVSHPSTAQAEGLAFVINSNDATISLIDITSRQEVKRIPVLREPHHMALTPDEKSLLVGDTAGNTMFFLDPLTGAEQKRIVFSDPYQIQFSPDGRWLVSAALARDQIDIYDGHSFKLLHRIQAPSMPSHINFTPDSKVAFVSLQKTSKVVAFSPETGKILWEQKSGRTPAGVLYLNGKLLVGDMGEDTITVMDPVTGKLERKIRTGKGAHNLFLSPDGKVLYVCNRVGGTISLLDPATLTVKKEFAIPGGPDDLDFAPDGSIWATRRWAHTVAIINPKDGSFTTIPTGRSPHGIWLNTHLAAPVRAASTRAP